MAYVCYVTASNENQRQMADVPPSSVVRHYKVDVSILLDVVDLILIPDC